ncbi:MAG: MerR family transcriptional regulator, partial [Polyangiaceae bacterium]
MRWPDLLEGQSSQAAPPMSTTPEPARIEYTIDELAASAKVPSRTIRFYQSRGALMPPEIRGRVAYYGPAHIERLKLIAQLQDRGLRIEAIRDLLTSIDRGEVDLAEWLGVERQVQAPWANDQPRTLTEEELYQLAGSRRPGLLADLLRTGTIERRGDVYLVESPALLAIAMKLED